MSTFKDKGVVLKEYFSGEYDKTIVLLLKNKGRVNVFAKGARKPKSKYFAGTQLFSYCEFVVFEGNGFLSLTQVEIINSFYNISMDYDKFLSANYFLELIGGMILASMPSEDVLFLLIKSLGVLSKGIMSQLLVKSVFEIKFMQIEGYSPQLDECICCGVFCNKNIFFCSQGIICKRCVHNEQRTVSIDEKVIFIIKYILNTDIKDLFKISVMESVAENLKVVSEFFVKSNIEIDSIVKYF